MAKAAPKIDLMQELVAGIKSHLGHENFKSIKKFPSILEFVESEQFLDLGRYGTQLFPMQKIFLKCFYRGTLGNENIILTESEKELLNSSNHKHIIEKFDSKELFRELILVLGRRSGKNLVSSIIALYECMRLIELGNPFEYYHIAEGSPLCILNVASTAEQAGLLFNEIKSKIINSPYFRDKIGDRGVESNQIFLLTPHDIKKNQENENSTKGSIQILCGHSNSNALRGKRAPVLLFDEVSSYKINGEASGDQLYTSLIPCTSDFVYKYEENGVQKTRLDSKIITISSPKGKEGMLWKMYCSSSDPIKGKKQLSFRLPTWKVNLNLPEEMLREETSAALADEQFSMEYGAEFASSGGEKFLPDELIDLAINKELGQKEVGQRGIAYYAHLDPASTSHNYALVVVHLEDYIRYDIIPGTDRNKKVRHQRLVVDHIMVWKPSVGSEIDFEMVDNYIIELSKRFRFAMVSYDTYESRASTQKLRKHGIPTRITPFSQRYKMNIYRRLENLFQTKNIVLPAMGRWAPLLHAELKCLRRRYTATGFKIMPNPEGAVITDDICDSLAGACGVAGETELNGLAKPELVNLPLIRDRNMWQIGYNRFADSQYRNYRFK